MKTKTTKKTRSKTEIEKDLRDCLEKQLELFEKVANLREENKELKDENLYFMKLIKGKTIESYTTFGIIQ